MRRTSILDRVPRPAKRRETPRRLKLENLEPRLVLTSLTLEQALGELSGHSGVCSCPVCTGIGLSLIASEEPAASSLSAAPLSSLPQLSSNPNASAKLFLDFDGHFESSWGSDINVTTPAFSQDGDTSTFSDGELTAIYEIWARVAEDYAPFNLDVTTIDPGNQTNRVTAVIAIGGNYSDWYGSAAGGVAYIGGFYNSSSNVGYVFEDALSSNARYIAEASSHEAGHLFGLRHQSVWSGSTLTQTYNSGDSNWAPIMGNSYSSARSTWHNGTTNVSSTSYQDDVAVIAGTNNAFGYKSDDFGNTIPYTSQAPVSSTSINLAGLIEHNADVDMWEFTTTGGEVSFTLSVAQFGPNLDAILELRDNGNNILFSSAPTNSFGASITANVAAGTYYLVARGNGVYGNIGQYTIAGTLPESSSEQPEISLLLGSSGVSDGGAVNFGTTQVGTAVSRTFTVSNDGNATLTLTALNSGSMPAGFTLTSNLGSTSLAAGESTSFTVRLDATSSGTFSGEIQLVSDDGDENPYNILISGSVAAPPEISMFADGSGIGSGVYVDFGETNVGSSVTRTFTVRNDGGGTLTLSALDPNAMPSGFTLTSNLGDLTLLNGETATFTVRLDAASGGSYSGQLQVVSDDSDENPFRINILGTVVTAPEISITEGGVSLSDGGSLNFGTTTLGQAVTRTFTVRNDGNATLDLTLLNASSMPAGFTLVSNLGSTSLAPGASTTFSIRLDASSAGSFGGTISLSNNDSNENPFDLTLSGVVEDPDQWTGPKLVDNGGTGWSSKGQWSYVTGKGREDDIHRIKKGNGSIQSNWTFNDLVDGNYWVWASWTANRTNATNAPFTVYDDTQAVSTWRVDQRPASSGFNADGTSWYYLGTVTIHSGTMVVRLTNAANGYVIADAVRMDKVFDVSGATLPADTATTSDGSVHLLSGGASEHRQSPSTAQTTRSKLQTPDHGSLDAYFALASQFASFGRTRDAESSLAEHLSGHGGDDDDVDSLLAGWGELEEGPLAAV